MDARPKTIFLDIDGCLFNFIDIEPWNIAQLYVMETTKDAAEVLFTWHSKGYHIVLTTARPESLREITITQLNYAKIVFDKLIMGLAPGIRYLINDLDPACPDELRAVAVNMTRNSQLDKNI